ncbi:MAG: hypothetical protein R3C15_06240 [Thermoleophilia bacterium]
MSSQSRFDAYALLGLLDRARLDYVIIGGVARVIRGSGERTSGLDIVPNLNERGRARLQKLLQELGGRDDVGSQPLDLNTPHGRLRIVPTPWGTEGYEDLRRRAGREHLGGFLRPQVASIVDLARMAEASPRPEDGERLVRLRRLMELEHRLGRTHGLGVDR